MNFLIADVIQFVSMINFSKGCAAKIKSKQFSEFGSRTKAIEHLALDKTKLNNHDDTDEAPSHQPGSAADDVLLIKGLLFD